MTSEMNDKILDFDMGREEVLKRAVALLGINPNPGYTVDPRKLLGTPNQDAPSHALGDVTFSDCETRKTFVIHAADAIITDGEKVVVIDRLNDPGKGLPALPGGFMDPTSDGECETAVDAAAREAMEEVGVDLDFGKHVGGRRLWRQGDIRVAHGDGLFEKYGVSEGDAFLVTTQGVLFEVEDLASLNLVAGDDALPGSARLMDVSECTHLNMGVTDHASMIQEAVRMLNERKSAPRW